MLQRLTVENFALLKHVDLSFDGRFNVLSGETGAGKSIIIDAVKLVLGERANVADIRHGEDHALVEAVFEMAQGHPVYAALDEMGIAHDADILVLTRQIRANGKNVCRINRQIVTLSQFKDVCSQLISIYGQHDYDELGDAETRLALLDGMGDGAHQALLAEVADAYAQAQQSGRRYKKAMREAAKRQKEMEIIAANVRELAPLNLKKGEEARVAQQYKQAIHSQELHDAAFLGTNILYDMPDCVHEQLTNVIIRLKQVAGHDPEMAEYAKALGEALIIVDDTARDLEHYYEQIDYDLDKLDAMDERLGLIARLRKKYAMDADELVDALSDWQAQLEGFDTVDAELEALRQNYQDDRAHYVALAEKLHEKRLALGEAFSERLLQELADMAMKEASFAVELERFSGDATGTDRATFMIAPNLGLPMRPLYDIASGGEMSRIMLAIKSILGGENGVETLIFDEIDTGIGGLVLTTVADKLEALGQREQVICVTHAAGIAARADRNFFIEKSVVGEMTETHVEQLDSEEAVIREIARMSGSQDEWQLEHAARQRAQKKFQK